MPWKTYNPKIAMPAAYKSLSDWGLTIPTSDEVAWITNPKHNWVYNKLSIAKSQNLPCGPLGTYPTEYPVIVKPIMNLDGGGVGAVVCHNIQEYESVKHLAGYFWSRYLFGTHYSVDLIILNGEIQLDITFIGEKLQLGLFDYWYLDKTPASVFVSLQEWVSKHLSDYTGCLNVEVLDNSIIEAHLRFGDLDRLGDTGLLESIHSLYNAKKWVYNESLPTSFYIAALFGQPNTNFTINQTLSNYLFKDLTYFQIDFVDQNRMGSPNNGQRLAIFCGHSLEAVTEARNVAIALITPSIHGKYTDVLTNYINLR